MLFLVLTDFSGVSEDRPEMRTHHFRHAAGAQGLGPEDLPHVLERRKDCCRPTG